MHAGRRSVSAAHLAAFAALFAVAGCSVGTAATPEPTRPSAVALAPWQATLHVVDSKTTGTLASVAGTDDRLVVSEVGATRGGSSLYTSADGDRWSNTVVEGDVESLAADSKTFVAVGISDGLHPDTANAVAWSSSDGSTWKGASIETATTFGMHAVAAAHGQFVAVGGSDAEDKGVAWASTDGLNWKFAPVGAHAGLSAITGTATGWLAVSRPTSRVQDIVET